MLGVEITLKKLVVSVKEYPDIKTGWWERWSPLIETSREKQAVLCWVWQAFRRQGFLRFCGYQHILILWLQFETRTESPSHALLLMSQWPDLSSGISNFVSAFITLKTCGWQKALLISKGTLPGNFISTVRIKNTQLLLQFKAPFGRLGGSVGWACDFGSGHDLTVCGFKPRVGLCADSSEPASDSVSPPLSAPPPLMLCLSLS